MRFPFPFVLLTAVALPTEARAAFRAGERVVVGPDEEISEDLYVAGGEVEIRGIVRGDLVVAGGNVRLHGSVGGDLIVAGGDVSVRGAIGGDVMAASGRLSIAQPVGGSVRAAAGEIALDANIGEDAVIAAGEFALAPDARIGRDAIVASGDASLRGSIQRNLLATAGKLWLAGAVGGSVDAEVGSLALLEGARVAGDLRYHSDTAARVDSGSNVAGKIEHLPPRYRRPNPLVRALRTFVGLAALGALLQWLARPLVERHGRVLERETARSLGAGALAFVAVPAAALLILILGAGIGGWWIGLVLLALFAAALAIALPLTGAWIGRLLLARTAFADRALVPMVVGAFVLTVLFAVPWLGPVFLLLASLLGLGGLVRLARPSDREPTSAEVIEPAA